jgi:N,N'-diacetyllegionaminate synthase
MKVDSVNIEDRRVGGGALPFVIAEVAQAHDGSLGTAHAFIDAAAEAGADAVKFQTHIARAESTLDEPFRTRFSHEDRTRYEYWERMEFSKEQWSGLAEHAREKNLVFLSSPFSVEAVDLLSGLGMGAWKIGSGEVTNPLLMKAILETGKPILLSTGMSAMDEIERSVREIKQQAVPLVLFQCTSLYPTPLEKVGLNNLQIFKERFRCPVGLSDHSGSIYPALAAMALGADAVEVHVAFHRKMFGPDVSSSVTFEDLSRLAEGAGAMHRMRMNPVDKDDAAGELGSMRATFGRSLALVAPLPSGTLLEREMLTLKKPGTGIPVDHLEKVIGKRLRREVGPEVLLRWEDLK